MCCAFHRHGSAERDLVDGGGNNTDSSNPTSNASASPPSDSRSTRERAVVLAWLGPAVAHACTAVRMHGWALPPAFAVRTETRALRHLLAACVIAACMHVYVCSWLLFLSLRFVESAFLPRVESAPLPACLSGSLLEDAKAAVQSLVALPLHAAASPTSPAAGETSGSAVDWLPGWVAQWEFDVVHERRDWPCARFAVLSDLRTCIFQHFPDLCDMAVELPDGPLGSSPQQPLPVASLVLTESLPYALLDRLRIVVATIAQAWHDMTMSPTPSSTSYSGSLASSPSPAAVSLGSSPAHPAVHFSLDIFSPSSFLTAPGDLPST
jgi:hypothetical protein